MLGHIAIAAMGGCFSQNPDTGAAEATYFPAESVVVNEAIRMTITRESGTTDFNLGFTQTSFWVKCIVEDSRYNSYPAIASVGTTSYVSTSKPRTWCFMGFFPRSPRDQIAHMANEPSTIMSEKTNPSDVLMASKEAGTNTSVFSVGSTRSEMTTLYYAESMSSRPFFYNLLTAFSSAARVVFFGDMMNNDAYNVHWRRLPMTNVDNQSAAVYDIVSSQFIEY